MSILEERLRSGEKAGGKWANVLGVAALSVVFSVLPVTAAEYELSDVPLFLVQGADPNLLLTVDDSGSMLYSFMPDNLRYLNASSGSLHSTTNYRVWALSPAVNRIYYDPDVEYRPPVDANGASLGNASFTDAWTDGYDKAGSATVNLETSFRATWGKSGNPPGVPVSNNYLGEAQPAYFYRFNPDKLGCDGDLLSQPCYDKVLVDANTAPPGVDGLTNFANWYSYYRTRLHVAKAAASLSFANLPGGVRVGYQTINKSTVHGVRPFSATNRQAYWDWLFAMSAQGSTPLRASVERAGEYFSGDEPYRTEPADSNSDLLSCRQNFHVLLSDGEWNAANSSISSKLRHNLDDQSHTLPEGSKFGVENYEPRAPYQDSNDAYLADVAFYYWYNDLRPGMTNDVPTVIRDTSTKMTLGTEPVSDEDIFWNPANNPAHWQHMVTHTVGMGVDGDLTYPDDYAALLTGHKDWGSNKTDDLWHAALNSRGRYLSAQDTSALVNSFAELISQILQTIGSYAPATVNAGTVSSEARVFFSTFDTSHWSGRLLSRPISDGTNCGSTPKGGLCAVEWDAGCKLTGGYCAATEGQEAVSDPNARRIITRNVETGEPIPFRWNELSVTQQEWLRDPDGGGPLPLESAEFGADRLDYLRGDRSNELAKGGSFRNRQSVLGDAIASNPLHVGAPGRFYPGSQTAIAELSSYKTFRTHHADRQPVVYLGANDGMLHAFNAESGKEMFAYIPGMVFEHLPELSRPDYSHHNYVDGPVVENDVYFDGAWRTVLLSGLGLGGQGYFALDITDPAAVSENAPQALPLWEFSDENNPDMGYSYSNASIVRLANGKWAAVFGNGINATEPDGNASTTGNAVLFVVDIKDGSLIKKLDTKVGRAEDPLGLDRPNGIVGVFAADLEGDDFIVDRLYATDMFGHVWAFDVSDSNTNQWRTAYGNQNSPLPLFSARLGTQYQPITSPPVVIRHPQRQGAIVMFGTGRYLGSPDIGDTSTQSVYGIWDRMGNNASGSGRDKLQEQEITTVLAHGGYDARTLTNHQVKWETGSNPPDPAAKLGWFMDLPEVGERVFQRPIVRSGRLVFRTVTPSEDPCEAGGTSWLMEVDPVTGGRLNMSVFDFNQDGLFDEDDMVAGVHASGLRDGSEGVTSIPNIVMNDDGRTEVKYYTGSDGSIHSLDENAGINRRMPWRQIR